MPTTSERDSRYLAERDAGVAKLDVMVGGSGSANARLRPAGAIQPLRRYLVLPEVTDEKNWFENRLFWADEDEHFIYQPSTSVALAVAVNKSVDLSEVQSWWDLLNPKWRGKVVMRDPRQSGAGFARALFWYYTPEIATAFTQRFYSETGVVFSSDTRQNLEWVADGRMLINISPDDVELRKLQSLGVDIKSIASLKTNGKESNSYSGGSTAVFLPAIDLPHPNAATVYVNWYLSKQAQQAMVDLVEQPSRRVDVNNGKLPDYVLPKPGLTYMHLERYAAAEQATAMREDANRWLPR